MKRFCSIFIVCTLLQACSSSPSAPAGQTGNTPRVSFKAPRTYSSCNGYGHLTAGDFNGDGILDVAMPGPGRICVYSGVGDGTFQTGTRLLIDTVDPDLGGGIASADFNHDGFDDIAVVSHGATQGGVAILRAQTSGAFGAPTYADLGQNDAPFMGLQLGDVDGDGTLDAVTTSSNTPEPHLGSVYERVASQPGLGSPHDRELFANFSIGGAQLGLGDLNNDGRADLAIDASDDLTAKVLLASIDGSFQQGTVIPLLHRILGLGIADTNGDGNADVVAVTGIDVEVFAGDGTGGLAQKPTTTMLPDGQSVGTFAIVDFNGDKLQDLVIGIAASAHVLLGDGRGSFLDSGDIGAVSLTTLELLVADFNKDGHLDVAGATTDGFEVLLGR